MVHNDTDCCSLLQIAVLHCYRLLQDAPFRTGTDCYRLDVCYSILVSNSLLQIVAVCYKLVQEMLEVAVCYRMSYTLLQIVAVCYRLVHIVTDCCNLLAGWFVTDCCVNTDCTHCHRLLQFVTDWYRLLQIVAVCYRLVHIVTDCCSLLQIGTH